MTELVLMPSPERINTYIGKARSSKSGRQKTLTRLINKIVSLRSCVFCVVIVALKLKIDKVLFGEHSEQKQPDNEYVVERPAEPCGLDRKQMPPPRLFPAPVDTEHERDGCGEDKQCCFAYAERCFHDKMIAKVIP